MPRALVGVVCAAIVVAFIWIFPLFHIVPLRTTAVNRAPGTTVESFDPTATAARLWSDALPAAARRAPDVKVVAAAMRANLGRAQKTYATSSGLGAAYYFVQGSGKVVRQDRNYVTVALDTPEPTLIALRVGPVFGNVVRDGCGLLDVNQVPGLQEFNALSAALNALVETRVLPALRTQAAPGALITFAGCAAAPEVVTSVDQPLLILIPISADAR